MRKGSIFGSEIECIKADYSEEIGKQLIELGLDKDSIEKNVSKNKKVSLEKADELGKEMYFYLKSQIDNEKKDANYVAKHIKNGANVNWDKTAFNASTLIQSIRYKKINATMLLLQNGADYDVSVDLYGIGIVSALAFACMSSTEEIAYVLSLLYKDIEVDKKQTELALAAAIDSNFSTVVDSLLRQNVSPNFILEPWRIKYITSNKSEDPMSPLMLGAFSNNLEMVKLLVDNGADINMKNSKGRVAYDYIHKDNNENAPQLFKLLSVSKSKTNIENNPLFNSQTLINQAENDLKKVMKK